MASENYIVINGKRTELTKAQLKELGILEEAPKANPFARQLSRAKYYYIGVCGTVGCDTEDATIGDALRYDIANYCTDKGIMEQRALHETLNRLLWRYSMKHGGSEIDETHFGAIKIRNNKVEAVCAVAPRVGELMFASREIAQSAINEIVEPFMCQHPEFKW